VITLIEEFEFLDSPESRILVFNQFPDEIEPVRGVTLDALEAKIPEVFRAWLAGTIPPRSRAYLSPGAKGRYDKIWCVIA